MQNQQQWNGFRPRNRKILSWSDEERMISASTSHPSNSKQIMVNVFELLKGQ